MESDRGLRVRMGEEYEREFERIKWNVGEIAVVNDGSGELEMRTLAGKVEGQRFWVYKKRMGNIVDRGWIREF